MTLNHLSNKLIEDETGCGSKKFACCESECIEYLLVCDGTFDCNNGKDEIACRKCLSSFSLIFRDCP